MNGTIPRAKSRRRPSVLIFTAITAIAACAACASQNITTIVVPPPAQPPQLFFACCDQGPQALSALLANSGLFSGLRDLHAGVAVALDDFSPERAQFVRLLNENGIPAVAWLVLSREQGYYVNARNAPQTATRFAQFDAWTQANYLRWQAVGLDIEPNFDEWKIPKWRIFARMLRRSFDRSSVVRARREYCALIQQMHARGYTVQTYQMNFMADERRARTTLLERIFGFVDVRGDNEVLMAYSSFNHKAGSAVVWSYGQDAQTLAVGSTLASGDPQMDAEFGPLSWDEFSGDLRVASHFSRVVGVCSLEGCLRQGFLSRLKTMDWRQSVTLSALSLNAVRHFRHFVWAVLWTASHLLYFLVAFLVVALLWVSYRRSRHAAGK